MANSLLDSIDTHNISNGDESWFDKKISATGELLGNIGEGLTYGLAGAVVAGINSIINSGIAASNFLGTDIEPIKTYDVLKGLDDNLADYYQKNEQGVEIGGFVLGAFIPGTAGVKALSAAKAGFLGKNMLQSSGLMTSLTRDYAAAAKAEYAAGSSPFTLLNKNTSLALAQGFGASVLDMAAFEVAVNATMFKSPMLSEQNVSDMFWNSAENAILFGGLGGVIKGFQLKSGLTKARTTTELETFPYRHIEELDISASPTLKIMNYYNQKLGMPEARTAEGIESVISEADRLKLITTDRAKTLGRLNEKIQEQLLKFTGNDIAIKDGLFKSLNTAETITQVRTALLSSESASRIGEAERLAYGDVLFPIHNIELKDFAKNISSGEFSSFFTPKGGEGARGFQVKGNLGELKIAGTGAPEYFGEHTFDSREVAFLNGYDIYRNKNGSISVNPQSKILQVSGTRRAANNLIVDLEKSGQIVERATPGLADLSSQKSPIKVQGDTVFAGEMNPIKMGRSDKFKPEEGNYLNAQARYIWANNIKEISWPGKVIGENDLPLLERAYQDSAKVGTVEQLRIRLEDGRTVPAPEGQQALLNFIESKKQSLAQKMNGLPVDEIALRLNADEGWLIGEQGNSIKLLKGADFNQPRYAKINYAGDLDTLPMINTNNLEAAVEYERQKNIIHQRHQQNFAQYAGNDFNLFPDNPNWLDMGRTPTSEGAGATLFGFANSPYFSAGGWAQAVAPLVDRLKTLKKTETANAITNAFAKLRLAGEDKVGEFAVIQNRLLASPDAWVFHPTNPLALIRREDFKATTLGKLTPEGENIIHISDDSVADLFKIHRDINGARQAHVSNMKGAAGPGDDFDINMVYPVPVDTTKLKHFVIVEPYTTGTMADKKRIIAAKDEATLQKLIGEVDQSQFRVYTKQESENFHKAVGDYDFSLGINESSVDSTLKRKGNLSQFFPTIDEKGVLDRLMDWHMQQEEILANSMVYHRYSQSFEELKHLSERYTNVATSQFRGLTESLERSVKDPYNDIIRTALNISRASEYQPWINFNNFVKEAIEIPVNKLRDIFSKDPTISPKTLDHINQITREMGQGAPFHTATSAMIASGNIVAKPWLSGFISRVQGIMSTGLLQWDTMNAINNTVGSAVLLAPETRSILNAIRTEDPTKIGKLADLIKVKSPDGSGLELPTVHKLISNAVQEFTANDAKAVANTQRYQEIGADITLVQQHRAALDNLTKNWSIVSQTEAENGFTKASELLRKWSGNTIAEQFNRFVSASVARQIGDMGIAAGVLRNDKEVNELIQLFVNRTQGNYLYSQRPIVFQGVVGQAISLFQTYQFNLMQQLFRYVGEGEGKTTAMLLGLQGGIYGMQGLPAFNFLNTHIVGNASGNTNHRDLYTASYTIFGKDLGDWMLYGAGSNALGLIDSSMRFNLYSRGDINPRQLTVLPTNISDIPMIDASTRFVKNLFGAANKLGDGGAFWPTMSQAIEHNGLSRPLAGLAQIAQGYTTTNAGSLLTASQDFFNIATLTRVTGGKPFDEAVALDAMYRINAYKAKNIKQIQELGSAIKSTVIGGREPTEDQVMNFATKYARDGGKIEAFNKFFSNTYMSATQSQVNKISQHLNSPFAQQLQVIMGGVPLPDFLNTPK